MKKLFFLFVCISLIVGCGGKDDDSKKSTGPNQNQGGSLNPAERPNSPQIVYLPSAKLQFSSATVINTNKTSFPVRTTQPDQFYAPFLFPANFHGIISVSNYSFKQSGCLNNQSSNFNFYIRTATETYAIPFNKPVEVTNPISLDAFAINNSRCEIFDVEFIATIYKENI